MTDVVQTSDSLCVSYPANAQPFINWRHIDGPMLHLRDGRIHWLTLWERIQYRLGLTHTYKLERKHWSTGR